MTIGKTIALNRQTFLGKVMSLLFNMLSMLVITFLPRSKRLLISWLQSPSAVILEPKKIKSDTVSTVSLSISHEVILGSINKLTSDAQLVKWSSLVKIPALLYPELIFTTTMLYSILIFKRISLEILMNPQNHDLSHCFGSWGVLENVT